MERIQKLIDKYRVQAQRQEEAAEKDHALEPSEAAASQGAVPSLGLSEPAPSSEDVDSALDMNADSGKEHTTMDTKTDGSMSGSVDLVVEDNGDNITKTPIGHGVTSSEVASESVNPDAVFTKPESIKETPEDEDFTDHIKIDNSSVLGGDIAENQLGMEE